MIEKIDVDQAHKLLETLSISKIPVKWILEVLSIERLSEMSVKQYNLFLLILERERGNL